MARASFSERYKAQRNGTKLNSREEEKSSSSARISTTGTNKRGSFSDRYRTQKLERGIGFDTFESDLVSASDLVNSVYGGWNDADTMSKSHGTVSSMYDRLNKYKEYVNISASDQDLTKFNSEMDTLIGTYGKALGDWDALSKEYSQFKNADAYENYKKVAAEREAEEKKSAFDEYRHLLEDEEFMKNANYDSAKKNMSFWDHLTDKSDLYEVNKETKDGLLYDIDHALSKAFPVESTKYQYMTDDELSVYYGLHALDKNKADDFLDKMSKELNERMTEEDLEGQREFAQMNGLTGTIASIGSLGNNLIGGISALKSDIKNLVTGEEVDANDYAHIYTNRADALRGAVSEEIGESTDTKVLPFLYDTGMSIANSALNLVLLGGSGSLANMSTQAYSSKMKEMQDRGASQTEMILTSALAAGIEAITEKIPMDNLLKPKGVTTLRRFIGETMKQAGIEATEEGVSSILNQTVDVLSGQLGGTSEFKNQYEDYLLRGYTEDEAKKEVAKGAFEETLLSALGGAISGGFMGGVGNAMEGAENRNIGKFVTNNNRLPELTDLATEVGTIGKGKNAIDYAAQLQNSPNNATIGYAYKNIAEEANRQADELDRSETKELITRRLVEMGESGETAMDLADAIIADGNGKASAAQRRMIENSGIAAEAIQDIKNNAEWTTKSTEGLRKAQGLRDKLKSISTMRDASVVKAEQRASEMNISDTTTDIETGKEIDIEGVRFDENGEAVLQTSEGERKISEVTLTSNNAIAVAYAEDMDREMADTFVSIYDGKQDFEAYKDSFNLVWNYGKDGYGSDSVLSHLGNLTESQALSIYKAGMTSEVAKAQKAVNAIKKQYKGFAVKGSFDDSIIDYTGADSSKVNFNDLSDNQKQNIVAAKAISEGLGLKVELFSSRHGENKANGYYDPKTNTIGIDVFAEQKGGSLNNGIMTAMSHEMTHWMKSKSPKLYNEMRELVMNNLSRAGGVSGDVLARIEAYKMDSRHGGNASDSQAIDELIARACEDMLSNSKVAKSILENMSAESRASFVDKIKEFLSKIKEAIASIMGRFDSESREAVMLREMDGMADKMAELWDSMLEDSVETNSAMAEEAEAEEYLVAASDKQMSEKIGIGFDSETNSLYPKQFSLKTWTESEYQQNVDKAVKEISKKLKVSEKKARQYIDNINSIAKMIADDRERLDYEPTDSTATSVKPNSEYKWTVDMSTLCAKRLLFTGTFDKIQKKLMNTALTSEDIVRIRQMMEERGYTVACGICYVESTRREMGPITEEFINRYMMSQKTGKPITRVNSEGKVVDLTKTKKQMEVTADKSTNKFYADRNYTPTLADLNTTDIDIVKRDHPLVYEAYLNFMNARGQAKPKLLETRTEYKGEILKHFNTASAVKARNDAGGLRVQSFSDFEVAHLIDMMQIVMDMSRVGLYSQAYTKVPEFADIFGGTGMKINLSLIAKGDGLDKNGNLIFDDVEGMDHKEAFRLREKWSENVGTILVGKNDAHIIKALADPRIDFVIPFHKSSWKESLYGALGLTGYSDYTDYQNEKPLDKNRKIKNFAPSEYWDYSKTGEENAQIYLAKCRADGRIPKFSQFAHCEGYWKLLIDFKMYDNNGVGSPQRVVRPDFDMEAAKKVLNEYEGGHRSFPSADDVVEDFVKEYEKNNSGRQYSDKYDVTELSADDYAALAKHFGTTWNFNVAGYMLTDGKMLDFSGKHWGDTTSKTRQVDHRDIQEVLDSEYNGFDTMVNMISNGNIRLMPESGGINLAVKPTKNQRTVLRRYIEYMSPKEGIVVDIDAVGGDTIKSIRFNKGTSADTVMKAIDNHFKGGNQSELMQFHVQYSDKVTDKETLDFLNNQETITTYKSMLLIDGKLYSPMATQVKGEDGKYHLPMHNTLGVWQQAVEDTKNLIRDQHGEVKMFKNTDKSSPFYGQYYAKYKLKKEKGGGTDVDAAYNPYEHSSNLVLNDQFESAYNRPNLVTVECEIPVSELTSGYKADYSKDSVGFIDWHSGTVAGQLTNNQRKVYLSRWLKPVRIVPESEVAQMYKDILEDDGISVPFNVVTPALLDELEKIGVPIDNKGTGMYQAWHRNNASKFPYRDAESRIQYSDKDSSYLDAVNRGDMETAQKMVDEAAKAAGYDSPKLYHGTPMEMISGSRFGRSELTDEEYAELDEKYDDKIFPFVVFNTDRNQSGLTYTATNKKVAKGFTYRFTSKRGTVYGLYGKFENPLVVDEHTYDSVPYYYAVPTPSVMKEVGITDSHLSTEEIAYWAKDNGYDGVIVKGIREGSGNQTDDYIVFSSSQLKSADPVTYDDNGNVIPLSQRFNVENEDIRYSDKDSGYAPTFYSHMARVIDGISAAKIGANSVVSYLKGRGVKDEEIKWSGIEAFLDGKKSVTKAELEEFVAGSMLQIEEHTIETADTEKLEKLVRDYMSLNLNFFVKDDGTFMTEELLQEAFAWHRSGDLPDDKYAELKDAIVNANKRKTKWHQYTMKGGTNYREILFRMPGSEYSNDAMKTHWGESGVLAHARVQDMKTDDGGSMLFIEEIQSDWHNEGHTYGYLNKDLLAKHKQDKEFIENEIKRVESELVSDVAEEIKGKADDAEKLAEQYVRAEYSYMRDIFSDYYGLSEDVKNKLSYLKRLENERVDVSLKVQSAENKTPDAPFRNNYHEYVLKRLIRMAAEDGYDSIGWTTAKQQERRWSSDYAEAYRIEYDQEMPKFLRKYGKKWGAEVGYADLENGFKVWQMTIPDSMKDSVLYEGQTMYSDKGSDGEELGSYYKNLARKLERENDYLKLRHENYKARIEKARRIEQITKKATRMNNLLKKNSKDYHVPEILKEPLEAVLAALDFSSKSFLKKGEPTGKDVRLAEAFSNLQDVLIDIDKAQINEKDIDGIYGHFDMPEGFVEYVRDVKQSINDTIGRMSGEPVVLNRLTKDELDNIYDILTILNKSITQMDKALSTTKAMRISAIADTTKNYLESIHKMGDELPLMQRMKKFLAWDNVLPVYGMSRFGEGGDIIMESLQNGWDKLAFNVDRVVKYSEETYKKEQLKEWEKSTKKFTVANGNKRKEITLTDAQIMSLYCLSKREQAMGHILGNGITIASHKTKSDGKIKFDKLTQKDHALITEKELKNIISSLSSEQIAVADSLQKFMNTVCAEWGNQVSMVRFGIKSFGEENYFPIKSDANVIESKASESGDSLFRLLNLSFTKSLTKNANNAIMVESVFDVFANHASDMAKYNALALPVLDAFKWYSAKGTVRDKSGRIVDSWSLKRTMDDAYGEAAKGFVRGLLLDMNGASSGGQDLVADSIAKKMMSNYKVASVAANLRVAILQPTSYMRAGLVLDKKYLTKALVTSESTLKNAVEKAKETCGIALWKSMGFYDTNISRGVAKLIKHDESVLDVVKDKSLILAEKGDEITWALLYRACLLEQKEKNPGMSGEALDKAVAERLREVIYKTQVVDSTLTRTQTMRSKSAWSQMLTSFMSEPSVSWSILSDVAFKWMVEARDGNHKRAFAKYGRQMKNAAMTYLITATTAAIMGAIPDALRDDDEDKNLPEKFARSTVQNLLSDVTGLLPYVRDIFNMAQGFQPSRMDQQAFSTIINGIRRLSDGEWTYKDVYTMARGISQASGIPISNVMREFETIWNATVGNIYSKMK